MDNYWNKIIKNSIKRNKFYKREMIQRKISVQYICGQIGP